MNIKTLDCPPRSPARLSPNGFEMRGISGQLWRVAGAEWVRVTEQNIVPYPRTPQHDGLDYAQRSIAYLQDYLSECEAAIGHDEEYVKVLRDVVERGESFIKKATGA